MSKPPDNCCVSLSDENCHIQTEKKKPFQVYCWITEPVLLGNSSFHLYLFSVAVWLVTKVRMYILFLGPSIFMTWEWMKLCVRSWKASVFLVKVLSLSTSWSSFLNSFMWVEIPSHVLLHTFIAESYLLVWLVVVIQLMTFFIWKWEFFFKLWHRL